MTSRFLRGLAALLIVAAGVTPARVSAQSPSSPRVQDGCVGVAHNRSGQFRDADGQPLTSPSVILVGMAIDGLPKGPPVVVRVSYEGRRGPAVGTALLNQRQQALVAVPITQQGAWIGVKVEAVAGDSVVPVEPAELWEGGNVVQVGPEEIDCDLDGLPTGVAADATTGTTATTLATTSPTGVAAGNADQDSNGNGSTWLWLLLLAGGVVAVAVGIVLSRVKNCADLIAECERLRAAAAQAAAEAAEQEAAAKTAAEQLTAAQRRTKVAENALKRALEPPNTSSYAEMGGRRVSTYDVALHAQAAAKSWAKYKSGQITADEVAAEWEGQYGPEALEKLRAEDKARREQAAGDAKAELGKAAEAETQAQAIADQASAAAAAAGLTAREAAAAAAAACAAAAECLETATADEAEGLPLPGGGTTPGPPADGPKTGDAPASGQPSAGPPPEEKPRCRCGPDGTDDFLETMRWLAGELRKCDVSSIPVPVGPSDLPAEVKGVLRPVAAAAWGASLGFDRRLAYGLIWMFNNGHQLDFWPYGRGDCGCAPCGSTVTFHGQCLPWHSFGDWMYGMCCGYFGFPEELRDFGGHFAENQKMFGAEGINWKEANAWGGWIRLDPEISRRLYRAGAEVGESLWADPNKQIFPVDFAGLLQEADHRTDCLPCPDRPTLEFERKVSTWPIIF